MQSSSVAPSPRLDAITNAINSNPNTFSMPRELITIIAGYDKKLTIEARNEPANPRPTEPYRYTWGTAAHDDSRICKEDCDIGLYSIERRGAHHAISRNFTTQPVIQNAYVCYATYQTYRECCNPRRGDIQLPAHKKAFYLICGPVASLVTCPLTLTNTIVSTGLGACGFFAGSVRDIKDEITHGCSRLSQAPATQRME